MNTPSSEFAKNCGAASHMSKLCFFKHSALIYPVCSGASPTIQLFPQSPKHGGRIPHNSLLIQPFGRWVPVTLFVFVDVEVRLLEDQVVDDASCARSCALCEDIIHGFVALELSCDESSSDSVLSVVRPPSVS